MGVFGFGCAVCVLVTLMFICWLICCLSTPSPHPTPKHNLWLSPFLWPLFLHKNIFTPNLVFFVAHFFWVSYATFQILMKKYWTLKLSGTPGMISSTHKFKIQVQVRKPHTIWRKIRKRSILPTQKWKFSTIHCFEKESCVQRTTRKASGGDTNQKRCLSPQKWSAYNFFFTRNHHGAYWRVR